MQQPRSFIRNIIAESYFEQALLKDPDSVVAKAGAATMLLETNRYYNRAARLITTARWSAPDSPDVLGANFRLLVRQGHNEEAVETFRRLLDVDSSSAGIAAEFVQCAICWGPAKDAEPLLERAARLNPLSPNRELIYLTIGRMLIMLGRDAEAIPWLEQAFDIVRQWPQSRIAARDSDDYTIENTKILLAAAYAYTGRPAEAHAKVLSALASERANDFTVRNFINRIPLYLSNERRAQEMRLAEGFRMAGLRDHLDEAEDFQIASTANLQTVLDNPTPVDVPGATTIRTAELQDLLKSTPKLLILTTAGPNPTIPGAIQVVPPAGGKLDDEWQAGLRPLMERATNGDREWPIVTFAYSIFHWQARNLALRLLALGYKHIYWYRGGWEAWDSHDLPKASLSMQLSLPGQSSPPLQAAPQP
jgi:tetratricopeptide (TPR) repeat protein